MSLYHHFVLTTISLSTLLAICLAYKLRKRFTAMHAMVVTMVIGMNIGLTSGVLVGSFYQGNLYYSTIISIAIGSLTGLACGISFGMLPSLEGFMSGLMGGMMGAMLGEMVTPEESVTITNILLALTTSSLLLFQVFSSSKENKDGIKNKKWFYRPILTFVFLLSFLLLGNQLDKNMANDTEYNNMHGHQPDLAQQINVNVTPSSYAYTPSNITVKEGQLTTITLNNDDLIEHDIEIKEIVFEESDSGQTKHIHGQADFHLHASAKSEAEFTFMPLKAGIYEFYCTIPGHRESGMTGTLVVT